MGVAAVMGAGNGGYPFRNSRGSFPRPLRKVSGWMSALSRGEWLGFMPRWVLSIGRRRRRRSEE